MRRSKRLDEIKVEALLNGEHERSNAILAVNVGATRMEAQDWAKVLQRMCLRWAKFGGVRGGILAPCRLVKDLLS